MGELKNLIDAVQRGALEDEEVIVRDHPELLNQRDDEGATPLHYAALGGHRSVVKLLVQQGAAVNATDSQFGATAAGWAIEYLRELGAFLGIELADLEFAIQQGDAVWVRRFLQRFPVLRGARNTQGRPFRQLARESGNAEILRLFESAPTC